jgi:drug/metabolite transporter (DMT)-like permease
MMPAFLPFRSILARGRGLRVTPAWAAALLLLAAFFWGAGNVANKTVLDHVGPMTAVALRCVIALTVILPLWLVAGRGARSLPPGGWMPGAVRLSLLFAVALALQQIAFVTATVTNASFLVNTAGILTPLLVWLLFGDRPGLRVAIAAPLTLVGAFLMAGATFRLSSLNPGDLFCLGSALFYALWMVALGRHAMAHGRPLATAALQFGVAAAVLLPLALVTEPVTLAAVRAALPELLLLGVFSTAAAFGLQTFAQRYVAPATAAILVSAESLFGAAGAVMILGEAPPPVAWTGAVVIMAAILLVAAGDHRPAIAASCSAATPATRHPLVRAWRQG